MIDIIIPAYNCSKTLDRTLGSLLSQTNKNFIVTIVDDCSNEDIVCIIDRYVDLLNINYIRNEKNLGCGMSRQIGIDNTKCKFFTFLDSDDILMPYTVDIFNSTIKSNPDLEFLHTHIYQQEENNLLTLVSTGFSYCHGKLYNRELIDKYGIKNSPLVKWHDDSFFNSMCSELMLMQVIEIPTVIWCFNKESITRKQNPEMEKQLNLDFLNAMCISKDFILRYKNKINHIERTVQYMVDRFKDNLNDEENKMLNYLKGDL